MNKRYNYIFFDLDNTLWDFEKNSYLAMLHVFRRFEIPSNRVSFDNFFQCYSRHNHLLWESYRNKGITKKELTKKRFQDTFNELEIEGVDPERMNAEYLAEMPKQNKLLTGVRETLNYLKTKNYQLFIITNGFKEVQYEKLVNAGIDGYFTKIFVSEDVKSPKPSYEIFEYAIKSSNAKKLKSLMVGDDWETDIMGASKFGIDSAYLNNSNDKEKGETSQEIYFLNKLNDLMNIL
jgi:putative hydrolase of the HAD superfamily